LHAELRALAPRDGTEVFECGVGPVESAARIARKLALGDYAAVVNAGIAGAFPGRARVGEARIVGEEIMADFGLEGGGEFTLPDGATIAERARADAGLLELCASLAIPIGRGLTVSAVTTTRATGERFARTYAPDVESMEGFSILRAAELAGVPAIEVRGISNYVGDRAESAWDFRAGARATVAALETILDALGSKRA
jgi:futalosine hydrolase